MRLLVGSDIGSYRFNPTTKKVKILDVKYDLQLKNILSIFNTTTGTMIYTFAKSGYGGTIVDNILMLDFDTTSMSDTDEIQTWIDIPDSYYVTDIADAIKRLTNVLAPLAAVADRTTNRAKGGVILESGTVTTCTTVTTCGTVTNLGSFGANVYAFMASNNNWGNSVGRRFT